MSFKHLIAGALYRAYAIKNGTCRNFLLRMMKRLEKGEFYSPTMRQIYSSYHGIKIGMYSYGGCFCAENIHSGTEIGRYCSFAKNVYIYRRNHPAKNKSTHPFFYNPALKVVDNDTIPFSRLVIGNDVWFGMNAVILPSVSVIGDGAVIGAGSIVTKDVPPYAIVAGNPARVVRYRFGPEKVKQLMGSKWWEKNIVDIKKELHDFTVPLA